MVEEVSTCRSSPLRRGEFIAENKDKLASLPAPQIACTYYYIEGDLYMFDSDSDLVRRAVGGDPRQVHPLTPGLVCLPCMYPSVSQQLKAFIIIIK